MAAIPVSKADTHYATGTIGYLYEDCQRAVKLQTIEEFETSWCGTFIRGYLSGAFVAMMKNHNKKASPEIRSSCREAANKELVTIKDTNAKCPYLLYLLAHIAENPVNIARNMPIWISWEKRLDEDILNRYPSPHINRIINSKDFCEYVEKNEFDVEPFLANPDLVKISGKEWESIPKKTSRNLDENYRTCYKQYINISDIDQFAASLCGAFHIGSFSGVYYTDTLPAHQADQKCANDIEIIRKHEITAQEACLPYDLTPKDILRALNTPEWEGFCRKEQ